MIPEAEEQKKYEMVKARFRAKKGQVVLVELNEIVFTNPTVYTFNSMADVDPLTWHLRRSNQPFVFISNFDGLHELYYDGSVFIKEENLDTGKVTYFKRQNETPIDLNEVRRELLLLKEILGKSEVS